MVKHLPHISIEKYAAYLDGNLPDEEMKQMKAFIDTDADMQAVLEADSIIGGNLDLLENEPIPYEMDLQSFDLPSLDAGLPFEDNSIIEDFFSLDGDRFLDNGHLYQLEGINNAEENYQQESEALKNRETMATSYRTYGESGENFYDPIYIKQPDDHSCGLRSQQIVLRDFGIDIPFQDLERYALDAGVYSENGTYTYDIGKVLEMAGVGMHQVEGSTIYDLTNELAQGHRVIVSVDAHELWYNDSLKGKLTNWLNDVFGSQGGNHALIVAGVEVNPQNPDDVKVVLTDSGAGHLRIEYPLNQFMDAWKDSNCFMAATDCPAPYQYDAATGREVPSNFFVEHSYNNQFVVDNGYQLSPDEINLPMGYQPAFTGHLNMIGDLAYDDYVSQHPFSSQTHDFSTFPGDDGLLSGSETGEDYSLFSHGGDDGSFGFGHVGEADGGGGINHLGESTGGVGLGETDGSIGSLYPDDLNDGSFNGGLY